MSLNIVAMSGGERTKAFKAALDLTGSEHPKALIVPTACSTINSYEKKVSITAERFAALGVTTKLLHEYGDFPDSEQLRHELGHAALIYTIGGNTPYLLDQFDAHNARGLFVDALNDGIVHAGTSAGALLPFEFAHSNVARRPAHEDWEYASLHALGLIDGIATVHANTHDQTPSGIRTDNRLQALIANFPKNVDRGYGIDDGASLIIRSGILYSLRDTADSNVHVLDRSHSGDITTSILD